MGESANSETPRSLDERVRRWEKWAEETDLGYTDRRTISRTISHLENEELQRFLIDRAEWHLDDTKFLLDFFETYERLHDLPQQKQQRILTYLSRKANRQLVYQLSQLKPLNPQIRDYIAHIDELHNVGVKRQVETLIRLTDIQAFNKGMRNNVWDKLSDIINYKVPVTSDLNRWIAAAYRHEDLAPSILSNLFTHYYLSNGKAPKSDWLSTEEYKLQKLPKESTPARWLNKKGKKKFMQELERKTTIARFRAFEDAIAKAHRRPLERIIGEDIPRSFIIGKDLLIVLGAYHKMKSWYHSSATDVDEETKHAVEQLKPILQGLLKTYVHGLDAAQEYLSTLPGNRELIKKINKKIFAQWMDGLEKKYELHEAEPPPPSPSPNYNNYMGYPNIGAQGPPPGERYEDEDVPRDDVGNPGYQPPNNHDNYEHGNGDILDMDARPCDEGPPEAHPLIGKGIPKQKKRVRIYDAKDPIEAMHMGEVTKSCTSITGGQFAFTAVVNAIDMNKRVFYMADDDHHGSRIGRTLGVLTRKGLVLYDMYSPDNDSWDYNAAWIDYFGTLAKKMRVPLILTTIESGMEKKLRQHGFREGSLHAVMDHAVSDQWYDNNGNAQVEIPAKGYVIDRNNTWKLTVGKNKFSANNK